MSSGPVVATAYEQRHDDQEDEGSDDSRSDLHPAWTRRWAITFSIHHVFDDTRCLGHGTPYASSVPRLWNDTIDAHRRAVRDATLDAAAKLVAQRGLRSVTMSEIAETTGIGRATLYKYFPDVESILLAWHERQITGHLAQLVDTRDRVRDPADRLDAVLEAYALIHHELAAHHGRGGHGRHGPELLALLHHAEHVGPAHEHLSTFMHDLLAEAAKAGVVRADIAAGELAAYCIQALGAASTLPSKAAVGRLVRVTVAGLRAGAPA